MCYYQVGNPTLYYLSGNVYVKFTKIEAGVSIYINAGSDVRNMTTSLVPYNRTVKLGEEFKIDQSSNLIVTMIPKEDSYNTTYSFEYWTDATNTYPWYELYYFQWFVKPKNGYKMMMVAGACAALFILILLCCFGYCCHLAFRSK